MRKAAERDGALVRFENGDEYVEQRYSQGYAAGQRSADSWRFAAVKAMQAEIDLERAKSENLYKALVLARMMINEHLPQTYDMKLIWDAIAEYEEDL